jgi:DNA-binding CsgD family transcriptional regulator
MPKSRSTLFSTKQNNIKQTIANIWTSRDELSLHNIRGALWPLLLAFPLSVIIGDLRYFDLHIALAGFESYELMLFPLGLGWLVVAFIPKRLIIPFLRLAAVLSALCLPFQLAMPDGVPRLALFLALQFFNGMSAGCGFFLFCFVLNNVERLFGMAVLQVYYAFYYTFWRAFPSISAAGKTWGGAVVMAVYLVVVFACRNKEYAGLSDIEGDGKGSGARLTIGLDVVYYIIMLMTNYIEWAEKRVDSMMFGIGEFAAIALVIVIQLLTNRSALYNWLLFLFLSLLGLGALLHDAPATILSGSFAYGLGDGLGYIIIYYICAGAIKRSASFKMFRLYCFWFFIEYFVISGIFSKVFDFFQIGQYHVLAFGTVFVMACICFLLTPLLQRRLFDADWTDGFHLVDMPGYKQDLEKVEEIVAEENLGLSHREKEIFALLLKNLTLRQIGLELHISYHTVVAHYRSIYNKLSITSKGELLLKFGKIP